VNRRIAGWFTAVAVAVVVAALVWWDVEKAARAMVAVASGVVAVWGAVRAVQEIRARLLEASLPERLTAQAWTPHLGLEFWQDDTRVGMEPVPERRMGTHSITRVRMKAAPFWIRVGNVGQSSFMKLIASRDDGLFELWPDAPMHMPHEPPDFFSPGWSVANPPAGDAVMAHVLWESHPDGTRQISYAFHNHFSVGSRLRGVQTAITKCSCRAAANPRSRLATGLKSLFGLT
jgi:hypothetical protein